MELFYYVDQIYSTIKSVELSTSLFTEENELLHQMRLQVDPILFNSLRELYGKTLKHYWNTTNIPYTSNKGILFVERRCHPNLEFCLQNAVYFARGYSVHIFCSEANYEFIQTICGKQLPNIHIYKIFDTIGTPEQGKIEYNNLLKQLNFWSVFKEDYILTMETDCYLLKPIPESIYQYDYVASKWNCLPNDAGGGGLTHRKTKVMKQICNLQDESLQRIPMQDSFASKGINLLNGKTPNFKESGDYFTESTFSNNSIGTHQWWTFNHGLPETIMKSFIAYYLTLNI